MTGHVPLELAQRLKAMGFDQNQFPQMIYRTPRLSASYTLHYYEVDPKWGGGMQWCAAPTPLEVVEGLEIKGWTVERVLSRKGIIYKAWHSSLRQFQDASLPALIDLMLDEMEKEQ